jgi:O-methyltransferase
MQRLQQITKDCRYTGLMSIVDNLLSQHRLVSDQVNADQLRVILHELKRTLEQGTGGSVVEFGCYIGTTSLFIRRLLDTLHDNREFHVYDSFAGLPEKTSADESSAGDQFQGGELSVSKKQFVHEFQKANLRPPIIHKAWFSDLTPTDVPETIAFAFLDGDFYESIHDSLKLVLPHMTKGSSIIIDDYAREALPGAARAVKEVAPQLAARLQVRHNMGIIRL